jgi:hypothetical protein
MDELRIHVPTIVFCTTIRTKSRESGGMPYNLEGLVNWLTAIPGQPMQDVGVYVLAHGFPNRDEFSIRADLAYCRDTDDGLPDIVWSENVMHTRSSLPIPDWSTCFHLPLSSLPSNRSGTYRFELYVEGQRVGWRNLYLLWATQGGPFQVNFS